MSRGSVSPSENEFKPYKQEQGGDMVDSDKISKYEQFKQETKRLVEQVEERNEAINSKNKEIEALKAQVKKLEDENKESKAKIKLLEGQIKLLEDQIKLLEYQIKKLKAEKDDMQNQLNDLRNEQSGLKEELAELEGNNLVLEEKVDHLEAYVGDLKKENKDLKEDVGDLKKENKDLKEDVGDLKKENKERVDHLEKEIGVLKHELHMANRPLLVLGELSFQIASLMYQRVIPQWHNEIEPYSVQDIAKDIKLLGDEEGEKSKIAAENTWKELKKELNWKEKYARSLKTVRRSRNTAAHPDIDEELLYNAAEEARKNGDLNNNDTYNNIKELIGIWKKIKNIK